MTIQLTENVTNLINKLKGNTAQFQKKRRRKSTSTVSKKNLTSDNAKNVNVTCNHTLQRTFREKKYEKPWVVTKQSRRVAFENQRNHLLALTVENVECKVQEFSDLPKDPVVLGRANFRKRNVFAVKNSHPPQLKQRYADTRFGDTHDIRYSGLVPIYVHRKKKAYKSLKGSLVNEIQKARRKSSKMAKKDSEEICLIEKLPRSSYKYISNEEREELLLHMKKQWDELMKDFQTLPFVIDTPPLIKRKDKMDRALQQLEKDIDTIKRHPHIFVYDVNDKA